MIAGIEKEELVLLKFKTEEEKALLRWEHSKEFEYRGQMYDVVLREQVGDSTYYHCWWDAEETALNQQLTDLTQLALNTNPERQKHQKTLYSFLQTLYFPSNYKWLACIHESSNSFISYFPNIQASIYFQPPTPPPEKA
jgi:magnesium-transporting ATPase (P-type)